MSNLRQKEIIILVISKLKSTKIEIIILVISKLESTQIVTP